MKKAYIPPVQTISELQSIVSKLETIGIKTENMIVNQTFEEFSETLKEGDEVILCQLDIFNSLQELLLKSTELLEKGISVESLSDSWFKFTPKDIGLLKGMGNTGRELMMKQTKKGLMRAKAEGKKLGRPKGSTKDEEKIVVAIKLKETLGISVVKACQMADCQPRTYYRYLIKHTQTKQK